MKVLVRSDYFDFVVGIVLVLNAIVLGVQTSHMADQDTEQIPPVYQHLERAFAVLFATELGLKLYVHRLEFFKGNSWKFNIFDFVVVTLQVCEQIGLILFGDDYGGTKVNVGIMLDMMRLLRLCRIVRLVRLVRIIPALKSMVYLVQASMNSFFWTAFLMVLMMYIVAVYYTDISMMMVRQEIIPEDKQSRVRQSWGTLFKSVYSLTLAITGGDDWRNFVDMFPTDNTQGLMNTLVFCFYIGFATLVMLNLVTGVFVEGAQRISREEKDHELWRMGFKVFRVVDDNQNHEITWEEFSEKVSNHEMNDYFKAIDLSPKQGDDLFAVLDSDGSGTVNVEEFVKGCLRLRGPARSVDLVMLMHEFSHQAAENRALLTTYNQQLSELVRTFNRSGLG